MFYVCHVLNAPKHRPALRPEFNQQGPVCLQVCPDEAIGKSKIFAVGFYFINKAKAKVI